MPDKKTKNISIYITFDGISDPLGQSQIIPYLDSYVYDNLDFYLVSLEKKSVLSNFTPPNIFKKNNFFWRYGLFLESRSYFFKFFDFFKLFFLCIEVCLKKNVKTIHCRGLHPALIGIFLKYFFNSKLIFDMRGFWIDEKNDIGRINKKHFTGSLIYNIVKKIEEVIIIKSDHIVVLTKKAKKYLSGIYLCKKKISTIPCSVDFKEFQKKSINFNKKNFLKENFIPKNSIIMSYCGSLGGYYMIDQMLEVFDHFFKKNKNFYFLFITRDSVILEKKIKNKKYKKNIISVASSWEDVACYLSVSNFMISFIKPTFAKIASSPTKISEAFAVGIPVISNKDIGDLNEIIMNNMLGYVIDIEEKCYLADLEKKIKKIKAISKRHIHKYSKPIFDLNIAKHKYKKIYEKFI